jgi:hypothetical protein
MLISWLLSDTWLMAVPARLADTAVCALALWLASRWFRCAAHSFGKAAIVSVINGIMGIGLYAAFVWVRDTGAVPWRNPWYLIEVFLAYQTLLLFLIIVIAYHRERWKAVITALATPLIVMSVEALAGLLLSVVAPHVTALPR